MTVCLAVRLPWPTGVNFGPGVHGPRLIAMASDSRISWQATGQHWDTGEKIVQFAGNAMLAFAGNNTLAQRVIETMDAELVHRHGVHLHPNLWLEDYSPAQLVRISMQKVYREALLRGLSPTNARLYMMVAFADDSRDDVRLVRFDTGGSSGFSEYEIKAGGVWGIGDVAALAHARRLCEEEFRHNTQYQADPKYWVSFPISAVRNTILSRKFDDTIGGMVQFGLVTNKGFFHGLRHAVIYTEGQQDSPPVLTRREGTSWLQVVNDRIIGQTEGKLPIDENDKDKVD